MLLPILYIGIRISVPCGPNFVNIGVSHVGLTYPHPASAVSYRGYSNLPIVCGIYITIFHLYIRPQAPIHTVFLKALSICLPEVCILRCELIWSYMPHGFTPLLLLCFQTPLTSPYQCHHEHTLRTLESSITSALHACPSSQCRHSRLVYILLVFPAIKTVCQLCLLPPPPQFNYVQYLPCNDTVFAVSGSSSAFHSASYTRSYCMYSQLVF